MFDHIHLIIRLSSIESKANFYVPSECILAHLNPSDQGLNLGNRYLSNAIRTVRMLIQNTLISQAFHRADLGTLLHIFHKVCCGTTGVSGIVIRTNKL